MTHFLGCPGQHNPFSLSIHKIDDPNKARLNFHFEPNLFELRGISFVHQGKFMNEQLPDQTMDLDEDMYA